MENGDFLSGLPLPPPSKSLEEASCAFKTSGLDSVVSSSFTSTIIIILVFRQCVGCEKMKKKRMPAFYTGSLTFTDFHSSCGDCATALFAILGRTEYKGEKVRRERREKE